MHTMKAVTVVGRGEVALSDVSIPVPGPGEAVIKVHTAAQNPADCQSRDIRTAADTDQRPREVSSLLHHDRLYYRVRYIRHDRNDRT